MIGHVEVQNNMQQTIHTNKINRSIRYVFETQSNMYDRVFLQKQLTVLQKSFTIDT